MLELKIFILELLTIDRLSTGTISSGEVSSLDHEPFDDSMKAGTYYIFQQETDWKAGDLHTFITQWLAWFSNAFLSRAQASEILCGFWNDFGMWDEILGTLQGFDTDHRRTTAVRFYVYWWSKTWKQRTLKRRQTNSNVTRPSFFPPISMSK